MYVYLRNWRLNMKISTRKVLVAFAVALPLLLLAACTTSQEPEIIAPDGWTYSEDEYNDLVKSGEIGTTKKKSSSSVATSSSSSSDSASVSSSATEESSSSATEGDSSSGTAQSSSSEDDDEEISSSSAQESSSSYEATFGEHESIVAKEGVLSVGVDAFADVDDEYAEDLEQVKASIDDAEKKAPEGYSNFGVESTTDEFNYDAYLEYDFYCLDKDGKWFEISRLKLAKHIQHFNNGADLGPLEGFKVSFKDACKAVYTRKDAE